MIGYIHINSILPTTADWKIFVLLPDNDTITARENGTVMQSCKYSRKPIQIEIFSYQTVSSLVDRRRQMAISTFQQLKFRSNSDMVL